MTSIKSIKIENESYHLLTVMMMDMNMNMIVKPGDRYTFFSPKTMFDNDKKFTISITDSKDITYTVEINKKSFDEQFVKDREAISFTCGKYMILFITSDDERFSDDNTEYGIMIA